MEDSMCYERRSYTSDEHKKASTNTAKVRDSRHEEAVNKLLRHAKEAGQKAESTPAKEYTPAK